MQDTLPGGFSVFQLNLNMTDVALSFDIKECPSLNPRTCQKGNE